MNPTFKGDPRFSKSANEDKKEERKPKRKGEPRFAA
jgi:hypothetical protein